MELKLAERKKVLSDLKRDNKTGDILEEAEIAVETLTKSLALKTNKIIPAPQKYSQSLEEEFADIFN